MHYNPPRISTGPYATSAEIIAWLQTIYPPFPASAITNAILNATTELIENRTQESWAIYAGSIFITGRDEGWIQCPITPILTLTGVNLYDIDGTVAALVIPANPMGGTVNGREAEIVWDPLSGIVRRVNDVKFVVDINTLDETPVFSESAGYDNVELIGTFGRGPYQLLKILQCLLAQQMLRNIYPQLDMQLESEKIADYQYRILSMERTQNFKNQRMTLDGYIERMFELLPKDYGENYVAI